MSLFFNAVRASARRSTFQVPKTPFRSAFRKFSTPPPEAKKSSNVWLIAGLGAVSALGGGYYLLSSSGDASTIAKSAAQSAKAATKFVPTKDDYQKVYQTSSITSHHIWLTQFFSEGLQ